MTEVPAAAPSDPAASAAPIALAAPTGTTLPGSAQPKARRLSKNLGLAAFAILLVLVAAILLGVRERQRLSRTQAERGRAVTETRAAPASAAASQITQGLGAGAFAHRPGGLDPTLATASDPSQPATIRTASGLVVPARGGPGTSVAGAGGVNALPPPTPEERALEQAYRDELEAMKAGTTAGTRLPAASAGAPANAGTFAGLPPELMTAVSALAANRAATGAGPGVAPSSVSSEDDEMATQNGWARKRDFGAETSSAAPGRRTPQAPLSPYLIRAGWTIPAILEQDLNSDLPGEIRALVTQNVYDTATGEYLLIPQGTRLIGTYDSAVGYGQGALQAIWTRLVFPDASVLELGGDKAQDASGQAGLRFRTNYHTGRLLGAALLTSLFSAGYEIAQGNQRGSILDGTSATDRAARGAAEEISRVGAEITRRNLNLAPTIEIPAGFRLQVFVADDLVFSTPFAAR